MSKINNKISKEASEEDVAVAEETTAAGEAKEGAVAVAVKAEAVEGDVVLELTVAFGMRKATNWEADCPKQGKICASTGRMTFTEPMKPRVLPILSIGENCIPTRYM